MLPNQLNYITPFFLGGDVFLYNPINMEKAVCSQEDYFSGAVKEKLPALFVAEKDATDKLNKKIGSIPQHIRVAYFLATDACNFKCKYCFVEEAYKEYPSNYLSIEGAEKVADFLLSCKELNRIIFYGGEPLLNRPSMIAVLKKVKAHNEGKPKERRIALNILTNGSLIDDGAIQIIKEYGLIVGVSIDGMRDAHDKMRITRAGTPTFDSVMAGWKKLKDNGINAGISFTLGSHNINDLERHVEWVCSELKPESIGFNLPSEVPGKGNPADVPIEISSEKLIKASEICKKYGVFEDRFYNRRVKTFIAKEFWYKDCSGVGSEIAVAPDGTIGPCHAHVSTRKYFIKPPKTEEELLKTDIWKEWFSRYPINMPECSHCPAISLCGGGCPYYSEITSGSMWDTDERVCVLVNYSLSWLVREAYAAKTGLRPDVMYRRPMPGDENRFDELAKSLQSEQPELEAHVEKLNSGFPLAMHRRINDGTGVCLFAEKDFKIIGFCNVLPQADGSANVDVFVEKAFRGEGIGPELLDLCLREAKVKGWDWLVISTHESNAYRGFFEKNGFHQFAKE